MKMLILALILSLGLAGCSTLDRASTGAPTLPAATATPAPAQTVAGSRCGGSLEGCFAYAEMDDYLDTITPMVASFFESQYPKLSQPRIVFVPRGRAAAGVCGYSNSQAYEYCGGNQTIYIGQDLLWTFYKQAGDAAPAIGLAHEWGHHVQFALDLPLPRTAAQSVAFENQADCISGAWARYAKAQSWLEDPDDLQDAGALLQGIGSAEGPGRDHGTAAERRKAFDLSLKGGIKACDAYSPTAPIG
ncbi:MAG: hypothetical protein GEU75_11130 [Dehalococcoidia bacterium]|nr:hypothetical protein [Dehalococcoidia bacterium]